MNEAQNILSNMGVKSVEQKRLEMAGAITRMVYNQALQEAKQLAAAREANLAPKVETPKENG